MELRTLRYFTVVAQELNITHAAEKLNMSQPPLSAQIKGLEDELGTKLIIRGKRHLQLTEAGAILYRRALQIIELADKTKQEIADLNGGISGKVSIGLVEGRPPFLTARWITGFNEEFPLVQYSLWNGSGDDVIERLSHGLVDLAVVAVPYDSEHFDGFCVAREPWVAIIPKNHPLAAAEGNTVPLSALVGEPLIVPARKSRKQAIRNWFADVNAEPTILCEMSYYLDAVALSEQGAGISIFPQTTYTNNELIVSKIVTESERQAEYHLIWNKDQHFSTVVDEFVNFVRDSVEEQRKLSDKVILPEWEYIPDKDTAIL